MDVLADAVSISYLLSGVVVSIRIYLERLLIQVLRFTANLKHCLSVYS